MALPESKPAPSPSEMFVKTSIDGCTMLFAAPNDLTAWRATSLASKEPDTVAWIGGFAAGDVLVDVGANVGSYTVLAAKWRGTRVFAFEPEAQNYGLLNRNIAVNGIGDLATAYCVALSDHAGYDRLFLSNGVAGSSCHSLGESVDHNNRPREAGYAQGCVSATLDELVGAGVLPVPNHVKVDVDGIEPKVIAGASRTLADPAVRSVLIEINTALDDHWEVVDRMLALGFDYSQEQVDAAQRKSGTFAGVGNYVFRR
jgi:FkbM family methyltransferase